MTIVYISFGSNKGDRSRNIAKALDLIRKHFTILDVSSFYNCEPVYTTQSKNFINGVIKVETTLKPKEVYERLKNIEVQVGRTNIERDENKPIDLDLIYFGDKALEQPPVVIPHHKAHQRKHILTGMNELSPDFIHPLFNKTQKQLLKKLKSGKAIEKIPDSF